LKVATPAGIRSQYIRFWYHSKTFGQTWSVANNEKYCFPLGCV